MPYAALQYTAAEALALTNLRHCRRFDGPEMLDVSEANYGGRVTDVHDRPVSKVHCKEVIQGHPEWVLLNGLPVLDNV